MELAYIKEDRYKCGDLRYVEFIDWQEYDEDGFQYTHYYDQSSLSDEDKKYFEQLGYQQFKIDAFWTFPAEYFLTIPNFIKSMCEIFYDRLLQKNLVKNTICFFGSRQKTSKKLTNDSTSHTKSAGVGFSAGSQMSSENKKEKEETSSKKSLNPSIHARYDYQHKTTETLEVKEGNFKNVF